MKKDGILAKAKKKFEDWKESEHFEADIIYGAGIIVGAVAGAGLTYLACKTKEAANTHDIYKKGLGAGYSTGYYFGYTDAYPVGFVTGSADAISVINKDKKVGESMTVPYPEIYDTPNEYLKDLLNAEDNPECGLTGLYNQGNELYRLKITGNNMKDNWNGFDAYHEANLNGDIKLTLSENKDLIEKKSVERIMNSATVAQEV